MRWAEGLAEDVEGREEDVSACQGGRPTGPAPPAQMRRPGVARRSAPGGGVRHCKPLGRRTEAGGVQCGGNKRSSHPRRASASKKRQFVFI